LGNTIQKYQVMEAANTTMLIHVFMEETLWHCWSGLQWWRELQELNGKRTCTSQVHGQHRD